MMKFQLLLATWIIVLVHQGESKPSVLVPVTDYAPLTSQNSRQSSPSRNFSRAVPLISGKHERPTVTVLTVLKPTITEWNQDKNPGHLAPRQYRKHSLTNVARRTAKRKARIVRHGANYLLDGMDTGIMHTQRWNEDLRDRAMRGVNSVPESVAPVVSPLVEGVVGAGNAFIDGTLMLGQGVVRSTKGLNEMVLGGVESVLKKKGPLSYFWGS